MYLRRVAALAAALMTQPLVADAQETKPDIIAKTYFADACAGQTERVAIYAPDDKALVDITVGATGHAASWDRFKFAQLCARPRLYVYHCHTTDDVLSPFPSGSKGGAPGDFGTAAEMEFSCAKAAALGDHPIASLVHGLVTRRGRVVTYGFTGPTLEKIHADGRDFGRMLREGRPPEEVARAEAEAQASFSRFNARQFDSFIAFAMEACPSGDIEHCEGLTVARFASTFPPEDWRFIRVAADAVPAAATAASDRDQRISDGLDRIEKEAAAAVASGRPPGEGMSSLAKALSDLDAAVAPAPDGGAIAELTPATLGAFTADGRAIVSICARDTGALLPCDAAKAQVLRLAAACGSVRMGILDQDRYPEARSFYPGAKDRSLLLFKTNPQSGLTERFDLMLGGAPTPQMIALTLCDRLPPMPSFVP